MLMLIVRSRVQSQKDKERALIAQGTDTDRQGDRQRLAFLELLAKPKMRNVLDLIAFILGICLLDHQKSMISFQ